MSSSLRSPSESARHLAKYLVVETVSILRVSIYALLTKDVVESLQFAKVW
jgi:hypothetical protein